MTSTCTWFKLTAYIVFKAQHMLNCYSLHCWTFQKLHCCVLSESTWTAFWNCCYGGQVASLFSFGTFTWGAPLVIHPDEVAQNLVALQRSAVTLLSAVQHCTSWAIISAMGCRRPRVAAFRAAKEPHGSLAPTPGTCWMNAGSISLTDWHY